MATIPPKVVFRPISPTEGRADSASPERTPETPPPFRPVTPAPAIFLDRKDFLQRYFVEITKGSNFENDDEKLIHFATLAKREQYQEKKNIPRGVNIPRSSPDAEVDVPGLIKLWDPNDSDAEKVEKLSRVYRDILDNFHGTQVPNDRMRPEAERSLARHHSISPQTMLRKDRPPRDSVKVSTRAEKAKVLKDDDFLIKSVISEELLEFDPRGAVYEQLLDLDIWIPKDQFYAPGEDNEFHIILNEQNYVLRRPLIDKLRETYIQLLKEKEEQEKLLWEDREEITADYEYSFLSRYDIGNTLFKQLIHERDFQGNPIYGQEQRKERFNALIEHRISQLDMLRDMAGLPYNLHELPPSNIRILTLLIDKLTDRFGVTHFDPVRVRQLYFDLEAERNARMEKIKKHQAQLKRDIDPILIALDQEGIFLSMQAFDDSLWENEPLEFDYDDVPGPEQLLKLREARVTMQKQKVLEFYDNIRSSYHIGLVRILPLEQRQAWLKANVHAMMRDSENLVEYDQNRDFAILMRLADIDELWLEPVDFDGFYEQIQNHYVMLLKQAMRADIGHMPAHEQLDMQMKRLKEVYAEVAGYLPPDIQSKLATLDPNGIEFIALYTEGADMSTLYSEYLKVLNSRQSHVAHEKVVPQQIDLEFLKKVSDGLPDFIKAKLPQLDPDASILIRIIIEQKGDIPFIRLEYMKIIQGMEAQQPSQPKQINIVDEKGRRDLLHKHRAKFICRSEELKNEIFNELVALGIQSWTGAHEDQIFGKLKPVFDGYVQQRQLAKQKYVDIVKGFEQLAANFDPHQFLYNQVTKNSPDNVVETYRAKLNSREKWIRQYYTKLLIDQELDILATEYDRDLRILNKAMDSLEGGKLEEIQELYKKLLIEKSKGSTVNKENPVVLR